MKIKLNRQEINQIRELAKTMDSITGEKTGQFLDNFNITRKAYLVSMVTGELTIEIKEEFSVELLQLVNGVATDSAPMFTAITGLLKALVPIQKKYTEKFNDLFNRYNDEVETVEYKAPTWEVKSAFTERVFDKNFAPNFNKEVI